MGFQVLSIHSTAHLFIFILFLKIFKFLLFIFVSVAHLLSTYYEPENNLGRAEDTSLNGASMNVTPFTELIFIWETNSKVIQCYRLKKKLVW